MSYLDKLPEGLRVPGSAENDEVELRDLDESGEPQGIVYEDAYVMLVRDPVVFPGGREGYYVRVVEKAQLIGRTGTVVLPVVDGQLVFIDVFRHATRCWEWEVPRGYQEPGLSAEENAILETREELGVAPDSVLRVGTTKPSTGMLSAHVDVFLAELPSGSADKIHGQKAESIRGTKLVRFAEIDRFVRDEVQCGLTLSAIFLARASGHLTESAG